MKRAIATIGLAVALSTPAFGALVWDFNTGSGYLGANPASPTSTSFYAGAPPTATITPGNYSEGWITAPTLPKVGGSSGFWDLGSAGSVTLSFTPNAATLNTLDVVQWVDGSIFTGNLAVSDVAGPATLVGSYALPSAPPPNGIPGLPGGTWEEYIYNVAGNNGTITITAPGSTFSGTVIAPGYSTGGAIIEEIAVVPETSSVVVAGALLLLPLGASTLRILRRRQPRGN